MRKGTVCPFCGQPMALVENPSGLVHGMPLCREMREAPNVETFLDRAAALVAMRKRAGARGRA